MTIKLNGTDNISDEMLAAYLDGNLSEEDALYVENAIENNEELQACVDEYLSIALKPVASKTDVSQNIDINAIRIMDEEIQKIRETNETNIRNVAYAKPASAKKPASMHSTWTWAAVIGMLLFVGIAEPILLKNRLSDSNSIRNNMAYNSQNDEITHNSTHLNTPQSGFTLAAKNKPVTFEWDKDVQEASLTIRDMSGSVMTQETFTSGKNNYSISYDSLLAKGQLQWSMKLELENGEKEKTNGIILINKNN